MHTCQVCGNIDQNRTFTAREMMFGQGDEFEYLECSTCGCVQLLDVPEDLSVYYPPDYYAFEPASQSPIKKKARQLLEPHRARQVLNGGNVIGKGLVQLLGAPAELEWLKRAGVGFGDAILDVGCGSGSLLQTLQIMGFSDLTGVDPFIETDLDHGGGLHIYKKEIQDLEQVYDFVMLNHVYEHMPDPAGTMHQLNRVVKPGGYVLIRIPIASSHAYRTYGADWVQLDAPRHLFLHTYKSIEHLAQQTGFVVADVTNDSWAFQFWGSEQYQQGIPLMAETSYMKNKKNSIFTADVIADFEQKARELNAQKAGDAACFYLRKDI